MSFELASILCALCIAVSFIVLVIRVQRMSDEISILRALSNLTQSQIKANNSKKKITDEILLNQECRIVNIEDQMSQLNTIILPKE